MRKITLLIYMCVTVFSLSGCDEIIAAWPYKGMNADQEQKAPEIEKIKSPELAKIILKSETTKIDVSRDPFKPLIEKDTEVKEIVVLNTEYLDIYDVSKLKFLGVAKIDDEYRALLKMDNKKGIYKIKDKIKHFTIVSIETDKVILNNGKKLITLKRGVVN